MKRISLLLIAMIAFAAWSCEKDADTAQRVETTHKASTEHHYKYMLKAYCYDAHQLLSLRVRYSDKDGNTVEKQYDSSAFENPIVVDQFNTAEIVSQLTIQVEQTRASTRPVFINLLLFKDYECIGNSTGLLSGTMKPYDVASIGHKF